MNGKLFQNKIFMSVAALFCCALWGISTPVVKMGYAYADANHIPSLLLWAGIQFALAGCITICLSSIVAKKLVRPKKENMKGVLIISLFQTVLQYSLLYIGLSFTTSVKGAILKSTDVFFVMLIASLIFKQETLTLKNVISCMIGFSGIIIMNLSGLKLNFNLLGDGLVVLAMVIYSFSVILTKIFAQNEEPTVLCGYQMTIGGCVMLVIGLIFGGTVNLAGLLPIILCLAVIYSVSYSLWTVLLKHHPASKVTIHSFMTPVFGVIFSAFMLQEDGGVAPLNLIAALVLVSFGILLWGCNKKSQSAEPEK